jgi:phospholipid/cholesterol/gamma-HCH transport system ATP-binding protein
VTETPPLFQVRNVGKAFGSNVLLRNANLEVHKGETLAIIGESGSGKSVFLKMLIGLLDVDEGEILFKGERIGDMDDDGLMKLHRQVGYVFQADALFDSMIVLENIGYAMREHANASDEEIRTRALECIKMVGLKEHDLEKYPAALSGGMRKRAALARAIAIKPEVILYDEPTQGLDPQNITRIAEMIEELQRELHVTSVVVTHDLRTAFGVSNRIVMLEDARFQYEGTPEEMMASTELPVREFIDEAMDELRELFEENEKKEEAAPAPPP